MVEVNVVNDGDIQVAQIIGEIDAKSAVDVQAKVLPLATAGNKLMLDMRQLSYMSSAGLRTLLLIHRAVTSANASVVIVGLSDDLRDTMAATGFLSFFTVADTYEAGQAALNGSAA